MTISTECMHYESEFIIYDQVLPTSWITNQPCYTTSYEMFSSKERREEQTMKDVPILPAAANFQAGASLPAPKSFLLSS